jgi:hypothetical protein
MSTRLYIAGLGLLSALLGAGVLWHGIAAGGATLILGLVGAPVLFACFWLLTATKLADWRAWISLAATEHGLYLVGRRDRVIFVPWPDVHNIRLETRTTGSGTHDYPALTLRLPEADWSRLSRFAAVKGVGETRTLTLPVLAGPGKDLVAALGPLRKAAGARRTNDGTEAPAHS